MKFKYGKLQLSLNLYNLSICSALKYLHVNKRIVHRDLNPSNIMIDKNYAIKLVDFGLSKNL